MEMVGVVCIVVGPQHDIESLAGALVNVLQESCFLRLPIVVPVTSHRNSGAIGQYKRGDIYSVGPPVLAQSSPPADVTARVGTDVLYSGDGLVEMLFRHLLQGVVAEDFQAGRQRARRHEAPVE